jgi:hypothetical protein
MDQKKMVEYLAFWVVNTAVLLVSSFIFSGNVVLGNDKVSMPFAALLCGLIITVFGYLVPPAVAKSGYKVKDEKIWGGIYFASNVIIVWVIKRFALLLGLGVASILYVFLVALLLTAAQWGAAMATGATGKGKK